MIDIDKLEALAKAATPGPWRGDRIDGTVKYDIVAGDYPNGEYEVVCHGDNGNASDGGYGFTSAENEDYALAANPAAILALIAELRELRADAERYRWLKDNVGKWECNYTSVGFTRGLVGEVFYPKCTFSASGTRYSGFMFEDAIDAARGAK